MLTDQQQAAEFVMMGLRLKEGINYQRFKKLSGSAFSKTKLNFLKDLNLIEEKDGYIATTNSGRKVLNSVLTELLN